MDNKPTFPKSVSSQDDMAVYNLPLEYVVLTGLTGQGKSWVANSLLGCEVSSCAMVDSVTSCITYFHHLTEPQEGKVRFVLYTEADLIEMVDYLLAEKNLVGLNEWTFIGEQRLKDAQDEAQLKKWIESPQTDFYLGPDNYSWEAVETDFPRTLIKEAHVYAHFPMGLPCNVVLVDTPGFGEGLDFRSRLVTKFLTKDCAQLKAHFWCVQLAGAKLAQTKALLFKAMIPNFDNGRILMRYRKGSKFDKVKPETAAKKELEAYIDYMVQNEILRSADQLPFTQRCTLYVDHEEEWLNYMRVILQDLSEASLAQLTTLLNIRLADLNFLEDEIRKAAQ